MGDEYGSGVIWSGGNGVGAFGGEQAEVIARQNRQLKKRTPCTFIFTPNRIDYFFLWNSIN
jgi:hypothetical protein